MKSRLRLFKQQQPSMLERQCRLKKVALCVLVFFVMSSLVPSTVFAGGYMNSLYLQYNGHIYKYNSRVISIEIDQKSVETGDMPGVLINNTTMVPVREVFESPAIGATVNWNATTQEVYISYLDQFIVLKIDSKTAYVNNKPVQLDIPPMLIRDMSKDYPKTMLPLRFVSENLGFDVKWEEDSYTAAIITKKNVTIDNDDDSKPDAEDQNDITQGDEEIIDALDATVILADKLDKLIATKANRTLPTELASNPVIFKAMMDLDAITDQQESTSTKTPTETSTKEPLTFTKAGLKSLEYNEALKIFEIDLDSALEDISAHVWDGKLIIKLINSTTKLTSNILEFPQHESVSKIRIGENKDENNVPYTNLVFDLKVTNVKYTIKLSQDRKSITIQSKASDALSFEVLKDIVPIPVVVDNDTTSTYIVSNSVYEMKLGQNEQGDYIDVFGVDASNLKAFRLKDPTRLVFDAANTTTLLGFQTSTAKGQYVTSIRTSQFEPTKTRIVIETDGQPDFQIIRLNSTTARIQILEPTFDNISYDNSTETPTIVIDKEDVSNEITIDNIQYVNNYWDKEFIITLPGDYTDYFGTDKVQVNDRVIESISFELDQNNNTKVIIQSTTVYEFRVEETSDGLSIRAYKPSQLYSQVVVVDAGHGGKDPGAIVGQIQEKAINLSVVLQLKQLLDKNKDIKVYYTRTTDAYPTLEERCILANEVDADIFVSVHCNSFASTYRGTETLYLPGSTEEGLTSLKMAKVMQAAFTANTALEDYKLKDRDNLYVLKYTQMPAVILEMGYLTNEHDYKFLADAEYHDDLAKGIYQGIIEIFDQYPTGR